MAAKTTKKPAAKPTFTVEELKTLSQIFHRVWDYIASDCLQMTQEMDGRDYMKRDEVIEVCLDAGRPDEQAETDEEKALLDRWDALPYEEMLKLARPMFPSSRYGF